MIERFGSTRARLAVVAIVAALLGGIGYWAVQSGVLDSATVYLRNEAQRKVSIGIVGRDGNIDKFLGGDAVLEIPGWVEGVCPTASWVAGMGSKPGGAVLVAAGTRIAVSGVAAFPQGIPLYVRIDVTGALHVGEKLPVEPTECTEYQYGVIKE
jgi:hypothetical protein